MASPEDLEEMHPLEIRSDKVRTIRKALTVLSNMTVAIGAAGRFVFCGSDPWQNPPPHLDGLIQQAFRIKMMRMTHSEV